MIFNITSGKKLPIIASYTGEWSGIRTGEDESFEIAFFTSGILEIAALRRPLDIFMVGGGQSGTGAVSVTGGGYGGNGGRCLSLRAAAIQPGRYDVTVGASGEDSAIFGETTETGTRASGGFYGYCVNYREEERSGERGGNGALPFDEVSAFPLLTAVPYAGQTFNLNGVYYGAGGGGGGGKNNVYVYFEGGGGGATGGGAGGNGYGAGSPGTFFGAAGGGGACNPGGNFPGGAGYQGIVLLRSAR